MKETDARLIVLKPDDNVAILAGTVQEGETVMISGRAVRMEQTLGLGQKLARRPIAAGEDILKYGMPVGYATREIAEGAHAHVHNIASRYTAVKDME